jgi:DNA-binding NarL/FixJ family response regulator
LKIKVLLADDHAVVLRGLQFFLATQPDLEIVGEAANGEEALKRVEELRHDVVLMDLMMPVMNGIEATKRIRERFPGVKIIVLTTFSDQDHVLPAIRAGANGYMLKDVQPDQLAAAIRGVYNGQSQLHPSITEQLMAHLAAPDEQTSDKQVRLAETLTARELEVLRLSAEGKSNKEIAAAFHITEKTVKTHVSHLLAKLDLADRTQAAIYAVKNGIVSS